LKIRGLREVPKESEALIVLVYAEAGKVKGYYIPIDKALINEFWKWYHEAKESKRRG
jgi:hypothetical protein